MLLQNVSLCDMPKHGQGGAMCYRMDVRRPIQRVPNGQRRFGWLRGEGAKTQPGSSEFAASHNQAGRLKPRRLASVDRNLPAFNLAEQSEKRPAPDRRSQSRVVDAARAKVSTRMATLAALRFAGGTKWALPSPRHSGFADRNTLRSGDSFLERSTPVGRLTTHFRHQSGVSKRNRALQQRPTNPLPGSTNLGVRALVLLRTPRRTGAGGLFLRCRFPRRFAVKVRRTFFMAASLSGKLPRISASAAQLGGGASTFFAWIRGIVRAKGALCLRPTNRRTKLPRLLQGLSQSGGGVPMSIASLAQSMGFRKDSALNRTQTPVPAVSKAVSQAAGILVFSVFQDHAFLACR